MTTKKAQANVKAQATSKAQAGAQASKRTNARKSAQAKAYKYARIGTYTYDGGKRNGETAPCADVTVRFRSCDFKPLNALAHEHNGGWSKFASKGVSRFLFDTKSHAEAFAAALDKAVAAGTFIEDETNISGRKARKAAGLRPHTDEWYAAQEARKAKAAAKTTTKVVKPAKKSAKQTDDIAQIVAAVLKAMGR